jgi:dimethylargininase
MTFRRAIVRQPGINFADGLTTSGLGTPSFEKALDQHRAYCEALVSCGLELFFLDPDNRYPDSTFVEDTAILTERGAIITRPGAPSRAGEVETVTEAVSRFYPRVESIVAPGTVDGGDICEAGDHFFIGISQRTNEEGATKLAQLLAGLNYSSSLIDIRNIPSLLHLKSGIAYLGERNIVAIDAIFKHQSLESFNIIPVDSEDEYAANCVRINDVVLVAAGYHRFEASLKQRGYQTLALDMSEYQKMDGGLSCLSLRF